MGTRNIGIFTLTLGLMLNGSAGAAVRYVKLAATGTGNCSTWANACTISTALPTLANPSGGVAQSGDEVWCREGNYPIAQALVLKNGVKIIGGFAGTETTASQSNPATRLTILDGGGTARAVYGSDNGASSVLRGFTVRNGKGDGTGDGGGGILLENSSALIVQCIFENNTDPDFGGAVEVRGTGSPQFINCIFRNNGERTGSDTKGGGAVFVHRGAPLFVNCLFHDNIANEGGAVLVAFGTPTFVNCTMANNQSTISYGGAVADAEGHATFRNCIVWGNTAAKGQDAGLQVSFGSGGRSDATYSNIQGGWPGAGNVNADPVFLGPGNYSLAESSPCKDAGENAALRPDTGNLDWDLDTDEMTPKDLGLLLRVRFGVVDIGAYEFFTDPPPGGGGN